MHFSKMISSPQFVAFVTFFVLFVVFSPGMFVTVDELSDLVAGRRAVDVNVMTLPQAAMAIMTGKKPSGPNSEEMTNAMTVIMHGILGGLIASAVFSIKPKSWAKRYL